MTNDFYAKRARTVLNHKAPHQKPPRIRNNKNYELDVNSIYLKSTYCFITWCIKLFIEDCIDILQFWIRLYALSLICQHLL